MSCSLCHSRKEKRFCLALHERICPQCCGEQREVTLDCPAECTYLQQARQHEKPRNLSEMPASETFPAIAIGEEFLDQHEQLIAGLLQTLGAVSRADRSLTDRELIGVLANLANTYQTKAASGLLYQEELTNPAQRTVVAILQNLLQEFREVEQKNIGRTTLTDHDVLKCLVFALRLVHLHTSGRPRARGFIDFLHSRFPETSAPGETAAAEGSRIILP